MHALAPAPPQRWEDLELIYAGQAMEDARTLAQYHVPPVSRRVRFGSGVLLAASTRPSSAAPAPLEWHQGCKTLIAIERAKLLLGKPDRDSAYWN